MGKYAVVENNIVTNLIVADENNLDAISARLGELVDAVPFGLCIGDLRNGIYWTRNLNGVQTILEPLTPQQQTDYGTLVDTLNSAEQAMVEGVNSIVDDE